MYVVAAAVIGAAWVPVLVRFLLSWKDRGNPISLAICLTVLLAATVPAMSLAAGCSAWAKTTMAVVDSLVCAAFHVSILWSRRRFDDRRLR